MKVNPTSLIGCFLLACSLIVSTAGETSAQVNPAEQNESFQIEFRDGTVVTRPLAMATLSWTDVSKTGQMSQKPIELAQVKSIEFANEPASEQLARILRLILDLDSDDFHVREAAEEALLLAGSRFRTVMEQDHNLKTADGIYRLKRVLYSLKGNRQKSAFELDVLTFQDGTILSGDAGNGPLRVLSSDGTVRKIERKMIADIRRPQPLSGTRDQASRAVKTKLFHSHADFMKQRKLKLVDFEHTPSGESMGSFNKDVSETFVDWGLVLQNETRNGGVGISGYEFDGGDRPVGDNSVCSNKPKRFYGVIELTFCQPGTQSVPHGVRDVGRFVSRVNHSRDVIIQAWDAAGRLIGVCESSDEPCTFVGVSSTVPIAKVRVLSNPWLLELRKLKAEPGKKVLQGVDKDFAIDSVMFSRPVPIDSPRSDQHYFGRNGDLINANQLSVVSNREVMIHSSFFPQMVCELSGTNTIAFKATAPPHQPKPYRGRWSAMLKDNSVVQWSTAKPFFSTTLGREIDRGDIVALWPANQAPRLPLAGDFEKGKNVLVYPGCRVAAEKVTLNGAGYSWDSQTVLTEDLHRKDEFKVDQRSNDKPDSVAPQFKKYQWNVSELPAFEIPTIWLSEPTSMLASQGAIKIQGGEVIVFGEGANYQLQSLDKTKIMLTAGNQTLNLALSKVTSIVAPQE